MYHLFIGFIMVTMLFTGALNPVRADEEVTETTPAPGDTGGLVAGTVFDGEWFTFGRPEFGRSYTRLRIVEINPGNAVVDYTFETNPPVRRSAQLVTPTTLRFGE